MADDASYGVIDPRLVYNVQAAARAMGQSTRWVMDHLIDSDEIDFKKSGDYKGIPGWRLVQWVEDDMRKKSEWKEEVAEGRPKKNPKSESKPSSSRAGSTSS